MIAFSEEKVEDDRVKSIRSKSYQFGFQDLAVTLLSITLFSSIKGKSIFDHYSVTALISFSLLVVILYFHYSLYFDPSWNYSDNGPLDNLKKNKKSLIFIWITLAIPLLYWVIF